MAKKNIIIWVIIVLFALSILPGEGQKAADQQAIVATEYSCIDDTDCPTCVGGFVTINSTVEEDFTFLEELAYAQCDNGYCRLSEYCLIWDCGNVEECISVKQTILDNTVVKFQENPIWLLAIIGLIVAYLML